MPVATEPDRRDGSLHLELPDHLPRIGLDKRHRARAGAHQQLAVLEHRERTRPLLELGAVGPHVLQQLGLEVKLHDVTRGGGRVRRNVIVVHLDRRDIADDPPRHHVLWRRLPRHRVDAPHPQVVVPADHKDVVGPVGERAARGVPAATVRGALVKEGLPGRRLPHRERAVGRPSQRHQVLVRRRPRNALDRVLVQRQPFDLRLGRKVPQNDGCVKGRHLPRGHQLSALRDCNARHIPGVPLEELLPTLLADLFDDDRGSKRVEQMFPVWVHLQSGRHFAVESDR
mmetsp:Transcript_3663/g.11491  ORF Transcript_3663/g.11491 Transcript_3663/m.11491 type:complete len:285 (+) Transcript_3663:1116-1970(+)